MKSRFVVAISLGASLAIPALAQVAAPTPIGPKPDNWPGKGYPKSFQVWEERRALFARDKERDKEAVVFLGDSITHGWKLVGSAFPTLHVANRGIGGDHSYGVLWRLQEDVLDLKPKAVVMLIGINDIAGGMTPSDIAYNIRLIVDRMYKANPKMPVILCKVMPWKVVPGKSPERVMQLNRLIETIAFGRPQVAVCDTWTPFATAEGVCRVEEFPDLLHPNDAGREKWKEALLPVMEKMKIYER